MAVGVALLLAAEPALYHYAAEEVRSGDPEYIWEEAVTVWAILNVEVALIVAFGVYVVGQVSKRDAEDRARCN